MANVDKMTNVKALAFVLENTVLPEDVAEKISAIKASYEKKSSNKKPTSNQVENEALKVAIVEALAEAGVPMTATEVMNAVGLKSCAKATALLTALAKEQKIVRELDKKTAKFSVPAVA